MWDVKILVTRVHHERSMPKTLGFELARNRTFLLKLYVIFLKWFLISCGCNKLCVRRLHITSLPPFINLFVSCISCHFLSLTGIIYLACLRLCSVITHFFISEPKLCSIKLCIDYLCKHKCIHKKVGSSQDP